MRWTVTNQQDPDAFEARCFSVLRLTLLFIKELDPNAAYLPGERTAIVRERVLLALAGASPGWRGVDVEWLLALEEACDAHLESSPPPGPGEGG